VKPAQLPEALRALASRLVADGDDELRRTAPAAR
jgi:hypothetical protein